MFKDYDPRQPKADLTISDSLFRDMLFPEFERYGCELGLRDNRDIGSLHICIHTEERHAKGRRTRSVGDLRGVAAGNAYHITDHDHDALNREILTVSTDLMSEDVGIHSGSTQQYTYRVNPEAHPMDEVFCPERTAHKRRIRGIQRTVITGPENQEIWTNGHGYVKAQFEWDRYGQHDESSLSWARMSNGWSGDQFGTMQIPHIGQEVLVDYLDGDPNTLVIVDRVSNQPNTPLWALLTQHTLPGTANGRLFGRRCNHPLMDGTQEQTQAQLPSGHQTSQLSPGYLTGVPGQPGCKSLCSEGFGLRTSGQDSV